MGEVKAAFQPTVTLQKVTRDADGVVTKTEAQLGFVPVLADAEAHTYTGLPINAPKVIKLSLDLEEGDFQAIVAIGAYDADGVFHRSLDRNHPVAMWRINRRETPELWDKYCEGKTVFDLNQILTDLHDEGLFAVMAEKLWGVPATEAVVESVPTFAPLPLPDLEIAHG